MADELPQRRNSMNQRFFETFDKCLDKYFSQIQSDFDLQVEQINALSDVEYQMTNKHISLTVSLCNSYRISVSTSFERPGCSCRVFGLNLIMQVLDPDFDLGSENILTDEELDYVVQKHAKAIKQYCSDVLNGDFSQWVLFEDYAERKLKEKNGI
jgi:hypothetical protein